MKQRLLELFKSAGGGYLSGGEISKALEVSRTAVWKHIQALKEDGFTFEAVPRRGYKLLSQPDTLSPDDLLPLLRTRVLGKSIHCFDEVDSTQNVAQRLIRDGAPEGTLVLAERQTAGRGRLGRHWHSPKGKGIYMSLVVKPEIPLHLTPHLTLLAAVALNRAIRKVVPEVEPGIKWPNDLLIGGKKISGILLESSAENEQLQYIVTGVGISCNLERSDYPEELADRATSLLIESGRRIDRARLIAQFLGQLEELYGLYYSQGFSPIQTLWEASAVTLGQTVRSSDANGSFEGTAVGLNEWGGLRLRLADGSERTIYSADAREQNYR
ncbi:biotin--[acetyl-CoA-carboxylase] ligase [Paenibacillus sp. YN15]|uniref:biotin--[acetyl-CoA-carboxylase] ligase n=1 Tax=Paenibacillus sp. YN15 TaxID=1742774 RepID=UPI000DCCB89F|nr:biotin--[acetyl-CoA-carboxylase] ligase [Paenibacillus sp. YN15]RAU95552.1 biotin--[acetyl-CoA-carboxylase] ligase [Paenibacillus sp. YN15]